jgi:NAD(P)-dependent dehydrogenase (short-subunit alcohol dehydrogenase family)
MELKDSAIIVTGGASGLGKACVQKLKKAGAKIAIFDLDVQRGKELAKDSNGEIIFCEVDIVNTSEVEVAIDNISKTLGAINGVVNCAGVGTPMKVLGKKGPIAMDKFNKVVQINLIGTMNVLSRAAEKMIKNKANSDGEKGVVINTASIAAYEGQIGQAAYSASKAGVVGMTLPIAREFADYGIRVMAIAPGLFETPLLASLPGEVKASLIKMIPFPKRLGLPEEFTMLVLHIFDNPLLNGETIRLDSALRMAAR